MKAEKIRLSTPLLKWYLEHVFLVTRIYQVIEFQIDSCFKSFGDEVTSARREGDSNSSLDVIANTMTLIGNTGYGSLIMDVEKHQNVKYLIGKHKACLKTKSPFLKKKLSNLEKSYLRLKWLNRK